jgi:chromosome segregation ATPase
MQIADSQRAHGMTLSDNVDCYSMVHSSFEEKVNNSNKLIAKLNKRADSLNKSIRQSRQSLTDLEAALRAQDQPLQVCMWRMASRERRPLRELVRDVVEVALESEKALIMDNQKRLTDGIKKTKAMIESLEDNLHEVQHDIDIKTQALSIDERCLRTAQRSYQNVIERIPPSAADTTGQTGQTGALPSLSRVPRYQPAIHLSSMNEEDRHNAAERINIVAANREEVAKKLREDCEQLCQQCIRAQQEALAKTKQSTQDRIKENHEVCNRLDKELRETDGKIDRTEKSLAETKTQIKALEEPADLLATCGSWRVQRATREHINDPVTTRLKEHQMTVRQAHEDLISHKERENMILRDLQQRRERLREDLKDKTAALQIDRNCLKEDGAHTRTLKPDAAAIPPMTSGVAMYSNKAVDSIIAGAKAMNREDTTMFMQRTARGDGVKIGQIMRRRAPKPALRPMTVR